MRLLHEPLLHFLLIGALLFGADAARRNDDPPAPQVIEITAAEVTRLQAWWSKQKGRAVTAEELRGLIEGHVREEVLYREALAMGLDQDDAIVRRRLAQKLEFLIVDAAVPQQRDEASLRTWFDTNRQRYLESARLSFSHVYFNPDRRGPAVEPDARAVLAALGSSEPPASAALRGDRFLPGHTYRDRSQAELASRKASPRDGSFAARAQAWVRHDAGPPGDKSSMRSPRIEPSESLRRLERPAQAIHR